MAVANTLWTERYRPQKLEDYVWINDEQRRQVEGWVKDRDIPHVLLSGGPGCGKSTLAKLMMMELGVSNGDIRFVNASHHRGIDFIRDLSGFAETMPSGDYRYVILDECLDENTLVTVLRDNTEVKVPISMVKSETDLVKTFNPDLSRIEWKPFELINKGMQDVLEIEFENNEVVICTPSHKWYVENPVTREPMVVCARDLDQYHHILSFKS